MRKAEERAKEAFPKSDWFNENRSAYIKGYEQAEEDYTKYAKLWVDSGEVNIKSFKQFLKDRGYE